MFLLDLWECTVAGTKVNPPWETVMAASAGPSPVPRPRLLTVGIKCLRWFCFRGGTGSFLCIVMTFPFEAQECFAISIASEHPSLRVVAGEPAEMSVFSSSPSLGQMAQFRTLKLAVARSLYVSCLFPVVLGRYCFWTNRFDSVCTFCSAGATEQRNQLY